MGVSLGQTSGPDLLRGEKFFMATNNDGVEIGHAVGSEPTLAFTPLASSRPDSFRQSSTGEKAGVFQRLQSRRIQFMSPYLPLIKKCYSSTYWPGLFQCRRRPGNVR